MSENKHDLTEKDFSSSGFDVTTTVLLLISLAVGIVAVVWGARVLWGNEAQTWALIIYNSSQLKLPAALDLLRLRFELDALSGAFWVLIGGISLATTLYSFGFLYGKTSRKLMAFLYLIFLITMLAVSASENAFTFLVFWEAMTIVSAYFVLYKHLNVLRKVIQAPSEDNLNELSKAIVPVKSYLIFSHASTLFLATGLILNAFLLNGDITSKSSVHLIQNITFFLLVIGFAIKAGIVPFHIWLPDAHPASPSNVHALMSCVMIKLSVYGLLRTSFFWLDVQPEAWWGLLVLGLGVLSAVVGVRYAIPSPDLKTLLSYHSIEMMGLIWIGAGVTLLFKADAIHNNLAYQGMNMAFKATLYHTLSHSVFKALLFLGTGTIELHLGTVKFDELGGLLQGLSRRSGVAQSLQVPDELRSDIGWLSGSFFVGAMAISGLPPFNGFISEWLLTRSVLTYGQYLVSSTANRIDRLPEFVFVLLGFIGMALAFGLTAYCFIKVLYEVFLGAPRTEWKWRSHGGSKQNAPDPFPKLARRGISFILVTLAILCLVLGVIPGQVNQKLEHIWASAHIPVPSDTTTVTEANVASSTPQITPPDPKAPTWTGRELVRQWFPIITLIVLLGIGGYQIYVRASGKRQTVTYLPVYVGGQKMVRERDQIRTGYFEAVLANAISFRWGKLPSTWRAGGPLDDRISSRDGATDTKYLYESFRVTYNILLRQLNHLSGVAASTIQCGILRTYMFFILILCVTTIILVLFF